MGKKQPKSPAKPAKPQSATKLSKGKASGKKRPASAAIVRDDAINEAEQKRNRLQENLWALEKQVNHAFRWVRLDGWWYRACVIFPGKIQSGVQLPMSDAPHPALMLRRSLCRYMTLRLVT